MTWIDDRKWIRWSLAALLVVEGLYLLGLTIVLSMIVPSAARFEGREPNVIGVALAGGVGVLMAAVVTAAAVAIWPRDGRATVRWLARATVLAAASLHVIASVGSLCGLVALTLGGGEKGSVLAAVAGWSFAAGVGLVVAFALLSAASPARTVAAAR